MGQPLVYKANALVQASYRLSLYEQRVVLACISQVRRDEPLTDQHMYTVSAQEIAAETGVGLKTAYRHLKTAAERLYRREVTLHEAPNGRDSDKAKLTRWVQTIEYRDDEGTVALRFGTDMVPYLSQLTQQFTRYALADVSKMTSAHAIRLYELLCQWRDTGQREVSVAWLREVLQLEGRYDRIPDLKRWVIEPAVKQINEHSPMTVAWSQRKTGRRVTHLTFTFETKESKARRSRYRPTQAEIKAAARPGETEHQVRERLIEAHRKARMMRSAGEPEYSDEENQLDMAF